MTAPISNAELSADEIQSLRIDLAAAFRLTAQFDWHESVGNTSAPPFPLTGDAFS
jgi:hypothetical protein